MNCIFVFRQITLVNILTPSTLWDRNAPEQAREMNTSRVAKKNAEDVSGNLTLENTEMITNEVTRANLYHIFFELWYQSCWGPHPLDRPSPEKIFPTLYRGAIVTIVQKTFISQKNLYRGAIVQKHPCQDLFYTLDRPSPEIVFFTLYHGTIVTIVQNNSYTPRSAKPGTI